MIINETIVVLLGCGATHQVMLNRSSASTYSKSVCQSVGVSGRGKGVMAGYMMVYVRPWEFVITQCGGCTCESNTLFATNITCTSQALM